MGRLYGAGRPRAIIHSPAVLAGSRRHAACPAANISRSRSTRGAAGVIPRSCRSGRPARRYFSVRAILARRTWRLQNISKLVSARSYCLIGGGGRNVERHADFFVVKLPQIRMMTSSRSPGSNRTRASVAASLRRRQAAGFSVSGNRSAIARDSLRAGRSPRAALSAMLHNSVQPGDHVVRRLPLPR